MKKKRQFYLCYTGCFLFLVLLLYSWFFVNGKTFVMSGDGLSQHYNALVYYRSWLREILKILFTEHRLEIPFWDLRIGYGSDVITTLHYYVLGDPLNLLSVFVPGITWMDEFYSFLVILRIYLAGLCFSRYCLERGNGYYPVLLGALLYAFGGWTINAAVRHPYFMTPMIYFPLVLLGADRVFRKKSPVLFIGSIAGIMISNFYFGYMVCILTFAYCVLSYFQRFGRKKIRTILPWAGRFLFFAVIGIGISAVILIPVMNSIFSAGRLQAENEIPLLYELSYYSRFLPALVNGESSHWTVMGYTAYGVLGILLIFLQNRKYTALKISFCGMTVLLALPVAGHIMNGFSYCTNRFVWAYAMVIAYFLVKAWPELLLLTQKKKKLLVLLSVIYVAVCVGNRNGRTELFLCGMVSFLLLVLLVSVFAENNSRYQKRFEIVSAAGLILCLAAQGFYKYSPVEDNYTASFYDNNQALMELTDYAPSTALRVMGDMKDWRYDQYNTQEQYNVSLQQGMNSTDYYWSIADGYINQFQREMFLNQGRDYSYTDLDGRSLLDALFSVKYFLITSGQEDYLPYGFDANVNNQWVGKDAAEASQKESAGESTAGLNAEKISVYSTENVLPLAYTYETYITRQQYEALSVTEKQQAVLQGVVLEESTIPETELKLNDSRQELTVSAGEGVELTEHGFYVRKSGSSVTLSFAGVPDSETYLVIQGMQFEGISPSEQYTEEEWEHLSKEEQTKIMEDEKYWSQPDTAVMVVSAGTNGKNVVYSTPKSNYYTGIHDFLVNTGYHEENVQNITLSFQTAGYYSFEEYSVICQPVRSLESLTEKLREEVPENLEISGGTISGNITVSKNKVLCFSVPYSSGWSAWVDGRKAEVKRANTMFLAIELPEGTHTFELRYCTPGWKMGGIVTVISLLALSVVWTVYGKKVRKKRRRKARDGSF